jgi:hypothetical protein
MNRKSIKPVIMLLVILASCDEPQTVVTDYVHADGSVTRRIDMKSDKNNFSISVVQVPLDSSWSTRDTIVIDRKGDTTWIRKCEKLFKNVSGINRSYASDAGANRKTVREASFKRKFRWFNTQYRFSEKIEKVLPDGYPVKDFLDGEELRWFYSPDRLRLDKEAGPDSLKYRFLNDSVNKKVNRWTLSNYTSGCIMEFARLTRGKEGSVEAVKSLISREGEIVRLIESDNKDLDSLWSDGTLLKRFLGEAGAVKFKADADSAISIFADSLNRWMNFSEYTLRISMPGRLTGMNGFIDSTSIPLWPVRFDFFFTEPYEMWAESRTTNWWAWVVSSIFIIFVFSGIIIKRKG